MIKLFCISLQIEAGLYWMQHCRRTRYTHIIEKMHVCVRGCVTLFLHYIMHLSVKKRNGFTFLNFVTTQKSS